MSSRTLKMLHMVGCSNFSESNEQCNLPANDENEKDTTDNLDNPNEVQHGPHVINNEILYSVPNVEFGIINIPEFAVKCDNEQNNNLCSRIELNTESLFNNVLITSDKNPCFEDLDGLELSLETVVTSELKCQSIEEENQETQKQKMQDDPDWEKEEQNSSSSDEETSLKNDNFKEQENITQVEIANNTSTEDKNRRRRKRRHVDTKDWHQEKNKRKREMGVKYLGKKKTGDAWLYNIQKPEKVLQDKCKCVTNNKSKLKCFQFTENDRKVVFEQFWKMSWKEKQIFITTLVESKNTERSRNRKDENTSRRACTYNFFLKKADGTKVRVCKTLFANTLAIKQWTINHWLKQNLNTSQQNKKEEDQPASEENNQNESTENKRELKRRHLKEFFGLLPKMENHYCRSSSSKHYLEPEWKSKSQLYGLYKNFCFTNHNDERPLSVATFHQMFSDLNLSLFMPKKDECDLCVSYRTKNVEEEVYIAHQQKKQEARTAKDQDKNNSTEESKVYTMDMQAVLLAPKSNVSALYYKTKLAVHNFTFYDLKTRDGTCFLWNESEGGLTASVYASIIVHFLLNEIDKHQVPYYILYSDGCTSQNRNSTLSNALVNLAILKRITIFQKYLERGHTQMECDSMHSTIERQMKNAIINVPADYVTICKAARKNPSPYKVEYLNHQFFKDYTSLQYYPSIRPGTSETVTSIRQLRYDPDGTIHYKLRHTDEWSPLPVRRKRNDQNPKKIEDFPSLYSGQIPIKKSKYDHLMSLKASLIQDYHAFYNQLPYYS